MAVLQHCPTFPAEFLLSWPILFLGWFLVACSASLSSWLQTPWVWFGAVLSTQSRSWQLRDVVRYVQIKIKTANKSQVLYFSYSAHKIRESCWPNSLFLPWWSICKNGVKILSCLTYGCYKDLLSNVRDVLRITRQPGRKLVFLISEQRVWIVFIEQSSGVTCWLIMREQNIE